MLGKRLINTKVAGGGGGCTDIVDNYDPFGDSSGVALYQLNGDATDTGANNLNGSPVNVTYGAGVFGQAGVFNGTSSEINLPNPSNIFNLQEITVSAWINISTMTYGVIYENYSGAHYGTIFWVREDTNALMFIIAIPGTNQLIVESTTVLNLNQWHHVAYTFSSTTGECKIYLNGAQDGYGSVSPGFTITYASGNTPCIGNTSEHGPYVVNGKIDQLRVFNRELTPLEIEALYTEELCICDGTVDTLDILGDGSCIATYQLDGNANDLSGNYSGTPTNVSYGVGEFDLAGVFNGSSSLISNTVGATPITSFSMWVKFNSTSQNSILQVFDNNDYAIFLYNGKLNIQYSSGSTSNGVAWTITNTTDWFHIAGTFTSSSSTLYVNKVQKTESMSNWINAGSVPYIGNRNDLTGYFNGSIDQVRIFNKALSSSEVTTLYNETACTKVTRTAGDTQILGDSSCIAYYKLDGTAADETGTYNGTFTNPNYGNGEFDLAGVFNGSSSYVEILNSNYDVRGNFSLSLWFKLNNLATNQTLFAKILNTSEKPLTIRVITDGRLLVEQEGNNSNYNKYSTNTVSAGIWYNLVWTADAFFNGELFINGVSFLTTNPGAVNINNGVPSLIGIMGAPGSVYNGSNPFNGQIDQVRIFNKALSAGEVTTLYNEGI